MTQEPEPTSTPAAPRRRSRTWLAVLALAALGGGAASYPMWRAQIQQYLPPMDDGFEVENLRAELSAATARIAQLESRPAAIQPAPAEDARLPETRLQEIDALAKQVSELKRNTVDAAQILRLSDRIEQAEATIRELQARRSQAGALLLAAGQLKEAVNAGHAYDSELRVLRLLAGEDAEINGAADILKDHAATGIPAVQLLLARFDPLAPRIVRAEILPQGDGWWRKSAERMLSLITIRREDGAVAGTDTAALVARAQAALGRGDLALCVAELDKLDPGPAEVAAPWAFDAKARVAADRALSRMVAQTLALAGTAAAKGAP